MGGDRVEEMNGEDEKGVCHRCGEATEAQEELCEDCRLAGIKAEERLTERDQAFVAGVQASCTDPKIGGL